MLIFIGLFHRAILQSGVATESWARPSQSMKDVAEKVAEKLGNNISDTKKLIEYLRSVDAISLADTVESLTAGQVIKTVKINDDSAIFY